jgi:hypothetical protein
MNANSDLGKHRRSIIYLANPFRWPLFSSIKGLISLFLDVKKAGYIDEIDLFCFVNLFKSYLLPSLQQTLGWHIALPEFGEARALSELFLVEEQSMLSLVKVMSE